MLSASNCPKINPLSCLDPSQEISMESMSGVTCHSHFNNIIKNNKINSLSSFVNILNDHFNCFPGLMWSDRKPMIEKILEMVELDKCELCKYAYFDSHIPYTRNLVASDDRNYSLLVLCWNPGMESKIHDHPCEGCFVLGLRGCIKETQYEICPDSDEIKIKSEGFFQCGQLSFMNNEVGLHKIGNPFKEGAISLHLYIPPFNSCKVINEYHITTKLFNIT